MDALEFNLRLNVFFVQKRTYSNDHTIHIYVCNHIYLHMVHDDGLKTLTASHRIRLISLGKLQIFMS